MFKHLIDYANSLEGAPGYTVCVEMVINDKLVVIEGAPETFRKYKMSASTQPYTDDGMTLLMMCKDEKGQYKVPTVVNADYCVRAWIEF